MVRQGEESGQARAVGPVEESGPVAGRSAKERLLNAVIEHFAADGLADQSLRRIAEAVGTSHRMLLYHFGSKDGLLLEVVRAVESRTQAQFAAVADAAEPQQVDEVVRTIWRYVADPGLADFERLFFALYGRALQGEESARPLLKDDIENWLEANVSVAAMAGVPTSVARTHSRLGLAVTRGLLLDLLATGDRAGVDAALEVFARRYRGRWWEGDNGTTDRAS
jgi:AcrR family transcriptional regulator